MLDVHSVRAAIPGVTRHTYLNCGTYGPLPAATADELCRLIRLVEAEGTITPHVFEALRTGYGAARQRLARLLNATEDEIALTANVSAGVNVVAFGLDWRPGDEVIMTDEEHPSGGLPWVSVARQQGLVIKLLPVGSERDRILERLEEMINPRTRIIFVSQVSCFSGLRLPVKEIADLARSRGVLSMIDGAHAIGMVPIDVREIGCDFYAANCHKWL
jgi:L-cysteine/cystine lyase